MNRYENLRSQISKGRHFQENCGQGQPPQQILACMMDGLGSRSYGQVGLVPVTRGVGAVQALEFAASLANAEPLAFLPKESAHTYIRGDSRTQSSFPRRKKKEIVIFPTALKIPRPWQGWRLRVSGNEGRTRALIMSLRVNAFHAHIEFRRRPFRAPMLDMHRSLIEIAPPASLPPHGTRDSMNEGRIVRSSLLRATLSMCVAVPLTSALHVRARDANSRSDRFFYFRRIRG
jgi:hypothetical protein